MMVLVDTTVRTYERIDLHAHSRCSDGALSPAELVALAAARQVELLALTDHDTLAGCEVAARECARHRIEFLWGSELTALWRGREIHVVGLRLDPKCSLLETHLRSVVQQRSERIRAIGAKLARCGLPGEELAASVLSESGTPTRLRLAELLVERGHANDVEQAFKRWIGQGQRAAVSPQWPALESAVAAILAARGLAVLAHPHRYKLSAGVLAELCAEFRALGGEGLEVSLPGMSPNEAARAASLARRFDLAGSCASDFHKPGLPWRPLGRFAKLPEGVVPITERLGLAPPGAHATAAHARLAT
jgi:3',5'-nucleoside bisphosphate phosphatase